MCQVMKSMGKKGNPNPLALYKQLNNRKDKPDFNNKYLKDKKFDWVQMEERHEASNIAEKRAVEGSGGVDDQVPMRRCRWTTR